jgi:hypothetical protein
MRPLTLRILVILVGILVGPMPSPAGAQDWSAIWRDPEIVNYELTMEKVRKLLEVQRAMTALAKRDPGVMPKLDQDFKAMTKSGTAPTVAGAAALLDRNAPVRATFTQLGVTSREWLAMNGALANAGIELMMQQRNTPSSARSTAQKANVALLEKNQTEWKQIEAELRQLALDSAPRPTK